MKLKNISVLLILINNPIFANQLDVPVLVRQCSPNVAPSTMMALLKTESSYNPLAININNKKTRLLYQAKNYDQATMWVNYLENHGYNFDVGIGQINIKNIKKFGYHARDLLDPCLNIKIAAYILHKNYKDASRKSVSDSEALYKAISAYNTGNFRSGFNNGYVKRVIYNARNSAIYQ